MTATLQGHAEQGAATPVKAEPQLMIITDHGTLTGFLNRDLLELVVTGTQFCLRAAHTHDHATLTALFGRVLVGTPGRLVIQGPAELLSFLTQQDRLQQGFRLRPADPVLKRFGSPPPPRAGRRG